MIYKPHEWRVIVHPIRNGLFAVARSGPEHQRNEDDKIIKYRSAFAAQDVCDRLNEEQEQKA